MVRVYGTSVAIDGKAVLFRGATGSGKSDLALRVIEGGGHLVADDQTILSREGDRLIASCPEAIRGRLEVRGIGILSVEFIDRAPLALVLDLVAGAEIARLPDPRCCTWLGIETPLFALAPFEVSALAKIRQTLTHLPALTHMPDMPDIMDADAR